MLLFEFKCANDLLYVLVLVDFNVHDGSICIHVFIFELYFRAF